MDIIKQEAEKLIQRFADKKTARVYISSQMEYVEKLLNQMERYKTHYELRMLLKFDFEWLERLKAEINGK
jgi:hypothetical protein